MKKTQTVSRRRTAVLAAGLATALGLAAVPLSLPAQQFQPIQRQALDRIVAVVNQSAIMASELEERVTQTRSQLTAQQIDLPPERVLREQLLERMILEEIQLQMAREAGLAIDDTELNRQVRSIAESNGMSLEQFADALEADGLALATVREEIRRELVLRELQQRQVGSRVNLSEREVESLMEQEGVSRQQAQQALFQRRANEELEVWLQEIRSQAFVDNRLDDR
ncbi:MAG: SurA N-terminal domain-containing protein [Halomonas sp.]|uniref:SurA N-terminal domain-containing protein n=1 Tax=Halomonas sp. TaxID=1486246 RepID=UPI00397068B0